MTLRYFKAFALPCLLIALRANGQAPGIPNLDRMMLLKSTEKSLYGDPNKERPIGSPYLNESFSKSTVVIKQGKYKDVLLRYNVYEDAMECKQNKNTFVFGPQLGLEKIELNGTIFVVDSYDIKGKTMIGFFVRLDSGTISMMSRKSVTFRDQQPAKPLEPGPTPPTFTTMPDVYYYKIGYDKPIKVESIKKLIAAFPDRQAELAAFVKKEKISKDEEGLIRLGKYLNSVDSKP